LLSLSARQLAAVSLHLGAGPPQDSDSSQGGTVRCTDRGARRGI